MKKKLNKKKIFDTLHSTGRAFNLQGWMDEIDLLVLIKHVLPTVPMELEWNAR